MSLGKKEFEEQRQHWIDNYHFNYRLLDIDFEAYMYMQGLSQEEFNRLNNMDKNEKYAVLSLSGGNFKSI